MQGGALGDTDLPARDTQNVKSGALRIDSKGHAIALYDKKDKFFMYSIYISSIMWNLWISANGS